MDMLKKPIGVFNPYAEANDNIADDEEEYGLDSFYRDNIEEKLRQEAINWLKNKLNEKK